MSPKTLTIHTDGRVPIPSVCIIGAGMSGLCTAIQLKRKLGLDSFVIFEKANDVGGAWLSNSYPGCQVDLPAWLYSFSFEPNPSWSKVAPDRDEMLAYLRRTAKKYNIYERTRFNTVVKSLVWETHTKCWTVRTVVLGIGEQEQVHQFNIVVLGTGPFREPNYPPEFSTFCGPVMHSAAWNPNVNLDGQVVGVVGSSSSAVQIIPKIAPHVKQLIVYMRAPNYVLPKIQAPLPRICKLVFTLFPFLLWLLRGFIFIVLDVMTGVYDAGSFQNRAAGLLARFQIWWNVKDTNLRMRLKPAYEFGCKVPTFAFNSYYQTFNRSNVELVQSPISRIEGQNVITQDGRSSRLDVLILCTGFRVQDGFAPLHVIGLNGVDLYKLGKASRPETFYGIACHEAPNIFYILGPNSGPSIGSSLFMIECQVTFVVNVVRELIRTKAVCVRVTRAAQAESMLEITNAARKKTYMQVGASASASWLLNEHGHPIALWPKSSICYSRRTKILNRSKFEFELRQVENV